MGALAKFRRLDGRERRLVLESLYRVVLACLRVHLMPYRRIRTESKPVVTASGAALPAEKIAWAVAAVSRYVPGATCLVQALAAETILRRHGHEASIRFGAVKDAVTDRLEAHAWVESDGKVLVGGATRERYLSFTGPEQK